MKINGVNTHNAYNVYNANKAHKAIEVKGAPKKDIIEISEAAKSLKGFSSDGHKIDNSERIAEIKKQISNGTYKIDAKLTAESMLKFMKEK